MVDIAFYQKVRLIYGPGKIGLVGELFKQNGYNKAFVVFDQGVRAAGILDKLTGSLDQAGVDYVLFDKVQPDPPAHIVDEGSVLCNSEGCDVVIGLGGGSSIDTAKGINILRFNKGPILALARSGKPMEKSLGLIAIPTTSGTGSEASDGLIITDTETDTKVPILAENGMSEYAIVDPQLMMGMPPKLTAYTGLDALAHACESATSTRCSKFTYQILEKVIELVVKWLPAAVADGQNLEAREHMAIAATLSGCMLVSNGTHAGHSFGHVLGAKYHIPHGAAVSYAEPYVMEYNAIVFPEIIRRIGFLLGAEFNGQETPEMVGAKTRDAYIAFTKQVGLPPLSEFQVDRDHMDELAQAVVNEPFAAFNPHPLGLKDARDLLEKIFDNQL